MTGFFLERPDKPRVWIPFQYERLTYFCYRCGLLSHVEASCPCHGTRVYGPLDPAEAFGPWIRVGFNSSPAPTSVFRDSPQSFGLAPIPPPIIHPPINTSFNASLVLSSVPPPPDKSIPGRSMNDSVITCHELMHHINRKKGALHLMAVKIDLAKAYDKVDWVLLKRILQLHGFPTQFINLIMECISSASFSVLVNGSPFGLFQSSCGLRQGDPLSPALFVIFIDLLSRMLLRAEAHGVLHGVKIGRNCPAISHLLYADDATIFCRAELDEAVRLGDILNCFGAWSDQSVNWAKSSIHFSQETSAPLRGAICRLLQIPECNHRGSYLGNSFCKPSSKRTLLTV